MLSERIGCVSLGVFTCKVTKRVHCHTATHQANAWPSILMTQRCVYRGWGQALLNDPTITAFEAFRLARIEGGRMISTNRVQIENNGLKLELHNEKTGEEAAASGSDDERYLTPLPLCITMC